MTQRKGIVSNQLANDVVTVHKASVLLTNDQVKALPSDPYEMIAAPGSGLAIVPIMALAHLHWVANYTNIAAGATMGFSNDNNGQLLGIAYQSAVQVSHLLAGSQNNATLFPQFSYVNADPATTASDLTSAQIENANLTFYLENSFLGELTGGNAGNTLQVVVLYTIIDLS